MYPYIRIDDKTVSITCPMCKTDVQLEYTLLQEQQRYNGAYIQNVLPDATPAEREMFISGTCPTCWEKLFADEE